MIQKMFWFVSGLFFLGLNSWPAFCGSQIEQTFKDPITGKSGVYSASFLGKSGGKNQGVLVFFHGSGNSSGYAGVMPELETLGKEFQLTPVAIQAPDKAITWAEGPNNPASQHVAYVKSFLEREIFLKHPEVNRGRVILVGFSAGSTFLSGDFLPLWISAFQGGAVLLCGGGPPIHAAAKGLEALNPNQAKKFPLYFFIQKNDFLYPQTVQSIAYWKGRKAQVSAETPEGGGHCAFDLSQRLRKGLAELSRMNP